MLALFKKITRLIGFSVFIFLGTNFYFLHTAKGMQNPAESLAFLANLAGQKEKKAAPELTAEQKALIQKYNPKDLFNKYGHYADPNSDFSKKLEALKKNFPKEKIDELINADIINLEKLFSWQNTLITSIDIPDSLNPLTKKKLSIGLYYKDIIKTLIWLSEVLADYWLKHNLNNQFSELIMEQLDQDLDSIINSLTEIQACSLKIKATKEKAEKTKAEKDLKELHTKLEKVIKEKFVISYKQIFKNLIHNKTIFYLIFQGLAKISKERWISPSKILWSFSRMSTTIKQLSHNPNGNIIETIDKIATEQPIPLYNLMNLIPLIHARPLTTGISITEEIFNLLLQDLKYYDTDKEDQQKYFLFSILDSDAMFLARTFLVFVNAIKNLNQYTIQKNWTTYLKNNTETFLDALKEYKNAKNIHIKNSTDTKFKEDFEKIKNILQTRIIKSLDSDFFWWLRDKNSTFIMSDLKTRLLLNIPLYVLAIKSLYNHYKEGNLSFLNWENIKNTYSHPEDPTNAMIIGLSVAIPFYLGLGLFITAGPGY